MIDTEHRDEVVCPHCGHEYSCSWEFADSGDEKCEKCSKPFEFSRNTTITYSTKKVEIPQENPTTTQPKGGESTVKKTN